MDRTINIQASLTRDYALPFDQYLASDLNDNVVTGTVTATRIRVSEPATVVETILTVAVARQTNAGEAPKVITVREQGGIVTVRDIRRDFEDKFGTKLSETQLNKRVDVNFMGQGHAEVGDRVLLVLAKDESGDPMYASRLRLEAGRGPLTATDDPEFRWPGTEQLNKTWPAAVRMSSLTR